MTRPERLAAAFPEYRFEEFSESRLPRFNVAPTQNVLGILNDESISIKTLRWGLVPARNSNAANGTCHINARSETIAVKPTFRNAFRERRCIIFGDGFYEWKNRRPVRFTLRDEEPFAFAGIWEPGRDEIPSCAIVTCAPNALVADVHDRMPVILKRDVIELWLSDAPPEVAATALVPFEAHVMVARAASTRLNNARYDARDVLVDNDPVQQSFVLR